MTTKKPVVPGGVGEGSGASEMTSPEERRQGELWDETGRGVPASQDNAGGGGQSAPETAGASATAGEAPPDGGLERGPEAGKTAGVLDEILRVVRYMSAVIEEGGRHAKGSPTAAPEAEPPSAGASGVEVGESGGSPDGSVAAASEGQASGQGEANGSAAELTRAMRTFRADFGRWVEGERRGRRRWAGLAMAAGFPAALMLGVLVEQQFQVIPLHDPTKGWGGHIWEMYGRTIVDCALEAMRTDAEVNCQLVVRRP